MDLIIFTGNIGCGKSLLASKFAKNGYVIVNNDSLTKMVGGGDYGLYDLNKKPVYQIVEQILIEKSLENGFSVVIDRTCVSKKTRSKFIKIGKKYKANIISYDWGPGTIKDLKRRNRDPRGISVRTWKNVFDYRFKEYEKPIMAEGFDQINKPPLKYNSYAFGFDGTIVNDDFPKIGDCNERHIAYMRTLWEDLANIIIIWTYRSGDYANQMKEFLIKNRIPFDFINKNPLLNTGSKKISVHEYFGGRNNTKKEVK